MLPSAFLTLTILYCGSATGEQESCTSLTVTVVGSFIGVGELPVSLSLLITVMSEAVGRAVAMSVAIFNAYEREDGKGSQLRRKMEEGDGEECQWRRMIDNSVNNRG